MRNIIFCTLLFSFIYSSNAQNRNSIWCFGDSAGIDFSNLSNPVPIQSAMDGRGSCASICDSSGQLLFYAQTLYYPLWWAGYNKLTAVYNKNNILMQGGDSIVGLGWYRELIITPNPANEAQYFLFSMGQNNSAAEGFYYSIVDMNENGGLGRVIQKNIQLLNFSMHDGLQAIKHGNGRDWWVFCHRWDIATNEFYRYLVTPSGISGPFIQAIGDTSFGSFLNINFSPSGKQAAIVDYHGLFEIYHFDRCTGEFSVNPFYTYAASSLSFYDFWSVEFSPDESTLYVSTHELNSYLLQLDLTNSDPWSTRDTLWTAFSNPYSAGQLELAPDNKIYFTTVWNNGVSYVFPYADSTRNMYNENLGVINDPNLPGAACNFQPYSFYLGGKRTYWGLPNNPNYEMPADSNSFCDTLTTAIFNPSSSKSLLHLYYHREWQKAFINAESLQGKTFLLSVFDLSGREVFKEEGKLSSPYFSKELNCQLFASGVYIVSLQTEKEKLVKRFVKE